MVFLATLVALLLVMGFGVGTAWPRDRWFLAWEARVQALVATPLIQWGIFVLFPALLVGGFVYFLINRLTAPWVLLIDIPVLLLCLGWGDLRQQVQHYWALYDRGDNVAASHWVDELRGGASLEPVAEVRDWQALHQQALEVITYRSFERLFAVLFWFFIGGAVFALIYRLSVFASERSPVGDWPRRWLWLIEWPAVRLLGLSWALVGNFDTCAANLRLDCFNAHCGSGLVLTRSLRGALGSSDSDPVPDDGRTLINSALNLYTRALWLWLCALAVITLLLV